VAMGPSEAAYRIARPLFQIEPYTIIR
jgi:hypothetical protein